MDKGSFFVWETVGGGGFRWQLLGDPGLNTPLVLYTSEYKQK